MSEPVSKAEVEDVLSSIRKLVSDDAAAQVPPEPVSATPVLVLSEDTVIQAENGSFDDAKPVEEQAIATQDVSWSSGYIVAGSPSGEAEISDAQSEVVSGPGPESVAVEEAASGNIQKDASFVSEGFSENAAEAEGEVVDFTALAEAAIAEFASSEDPAEIATFQRLEDKAAHMETMVSGQTEDWETEGTELADLVVGNLSGLDVSSKPETADIYVLGQHEAVTDVPFVLQKDFGAEDGQAPVAEPFLLTTAALVAREDIVLGAGSIAPAEQTVDRAEGHVETAVDVAEELAPEELVAEEPVAADETVISEVLEEVVSPAENESLADADAIAEMDTPHVDLPSAEQVEEDLSDAQAAAEPAGDAEVDLSETMEAEDDVNESSEIADPVAEENDEIAAEEQASDDVITSEAEDTPEESADVDLAAPETAEAEISEVKAAPMVQETIEDAVIGAVADVAEMAEPRAIEDAETTEDVDTAEHAVPPMDEEKLRELVADVVRQELRGALGERITRNMRKMVRREIYRTVSSRDFES